MILHQEEEERLGTEVDHMEEGGWGIIPFTRTLTRRKRRTTGSSNNSSRRCRTTEEVRSSTVLAADRTVSAEVNTCCRIRRGAAPRALPWPLSLRRCIIQRHPSTTTVPGGRIPTRLCKGKEISSKEEEGCRLLGHLTADLPLNSSNNSSSSSSFPLITTNGSKR